MPRTERQDKRYKNPDNDPRGPWASDNLTARNYYSLGTYSITTPAGRIISGPPKGTYWRVSKETFQDLDRDNRIWWGISGNNMPRLKRFLTDVQRGIVPQTIWLHEEVGNTQEAKKEVVKILPDAPEVFSTPKPTRLIQRILQIASNPGDLVLDSFAGSGTTGHAVLQLNSSKEDTSRRFILVEMDENISKEITAKRLQRAIEGYTWLDQRNNEHRQEGLGGGFQYCVLGPSLFDAQGRIREEVSFEELAQHVYFTETGEPMPEQKTITRHFLGVSKGIGVYLLYNGVLKDKATDGGNVLTREVLNALPPHDGPKIIYGTGCLISESRLRGLGITFRQIPYEIMVS